MHERQQSGIHLYSAAAFRPGCVCPQMCGRNVGESVCVCVCGSYHNDAPDLLIYSNKRTCHISKLWFFLHYLSCWWCLTRTTAFWDTSWHFCTFFLFARRPQRPPHAQDTSPAPRRVSTLPCFRLLMFPTDADSRRHRELLHLAEKATSRSNILTRSSSQCAPTGRGSTTTTTTEMLILCWRQPTQKRGHNACSRVSVTRDFSCFMWIARDVCPQTSPHGCCAPHSWTARKGEKKNTEWQHLSP